MCICFVGDGAFIDLEKNFRKQLDNLDPNAFEVIFAVISKINEINLNFIIPYSVFNTHLLHSNFNYSIIEKQQSSLKETFHKKGYHKCTGSPKEVIGIRSR